MCEQDIPPVQHNRPPHVKQTRLLRSFALESHCVCGLSFDSEKGLKKHKNDIVRAHKKRCRPPKIKEETPVAKSSPKMASKVMDRATVAITTITTNTTNGTNTTNSTTTTTAPAATTTTITTSTTSTTAVAASATSGVAMEHDASAVMPSIECVCGLNFNTNKQLEEHKNSIARGHKRKCRPPEIKEEVESVAPLPKLALTVIEHAGLTGQLKVGSPLSSSHAKPDGDGTGGVGAIATDGRVGQVNASEDVPPVQVKSSQVRSAGSGVPLAVSIYKCSCGAAFADRKELRAHRGKENHKVRG